MVIHGGISEDNMTLDSMCVLDTNDFIWTEADVKLKEDVVKSKKANMIMKQLYYVNDDGNVTEPIDMKNFKFIAPPPLSHHAAQTIIYDKWGSRNTKMLSLYSEAN